MMTCVPKAARTVPALVALALLSACKKPDAGKAPGPAFVMPPTQVIAIEARREAVAESLSLVGTLTADEMVEIKSEIDGLVKEVHFDEGRPVEKGQLLLQIDDSKLAASAAEAEANFKLSQANFERMRQLLKDKLVSQQEFDQAAAVFDVNRAGLDLKRQLLKDTRITAPFSGITGENARNPPRPPGQFSLCMEFIVARGWPDFSRGSPCFHVVISNFRSVYFDTARWIASACASRATDGTWKC